MHKTQETSRGLLYPIGALLLAVSLTVVLLAGCTAPIGADRVSTRQAYAQVEANAIRTGKLSADTASLLHQCDLDSLAAQGPDKALPPLHERALATGRRDLLYALAEMSYVAGERASRNLRSWDRPDPRQFYLGAAVYSYLFLFGDAQEPAPTAFDRRFRAACDLYNYGLGLAFTQKEGTNVVVRLEDGRRRLPVGEIEVRLDTNGMTANLDRFDQFLLADQFRVRGLSVRNRIPGVGAPLVCVEPLDPGLGIRRCSPATAFLRLDNTLTNLTAGSSTATLELHSSFTEPAVTVAGAKVPLEADLTTFRAYTLNQSFIWSLGYLQFLIPSEHVRSQLILNQPYVPGLVPVVFVHGTFSSPVTWAEMANTLAADPVLRGRCQMWSFVYSSGNPLPISTAELRDALSDTVQKLDPEGKDPALRQMVVIGHSQGGLLTKLTATETGDRLWNVVSTNRLEDLPLSEADRAELRHLLFIHPLPFVRRVVFICTPHRGSYLSSNFARKWARRIMSLPGDLVSKTKKLLPNAKSSVTDFLGGEIPTSLDSMSPKNPVLLTLAEIPVAPPVKGHSIIAVLGKGDYHEGGDGVVAYKSAHVDYVESEFIVHGPHSCLDMPATGEEVRRILREHVTGLPDFGQANR
jgi:pimeloyl-ACP methyl ester carboxylesterase